MSSAFVSIPGVYFTPGGCYQAAAHAAGISVISLPATSQVVAHTVKLRICYCSFARARVTGDSNKDYHEKLLNIAHAGDYVSDHGMVRTSAMNSHDGPDCLKLML